MMELKMVVRPKVLTTNMLDEHEICQMGNYGL
jgi:hypothetical protein